MHEINPILNASLLILVVFGWEAIASLAPEFKTPRKRNVIFLQGLRLLLLEFYILVLHYQ